MTPHPILHIAHLTDGDPPTVETDPYIPLKVRWVPPRLGPLPVYVRADGIAGGELELTINRRSGALLVLTLISLGPIVEESPVPYQAGTAEAGCGIVMDSALWEGQDSNVIELELPLRFYRLGDGFRIDIVGVEARRVISCGPLLTLAVDTDGALASISSSLAISESHFQS